MLSAVGKVIMVFPILKTGQSRLLWKVLPKENLNISIS